MHRNTGTKNTPQHIIDEIIRLHTEKGLSMRELSLKYKKPYKTIKSMIYREYKKEKQIIKGNIVHRPGRPRVYPITTEQELKLRINQLEREIDLYRSFLQAVGRM